MFQTPGPLMEQEVVRTNQVDAAALAAHAGIQEGLVLIDGTCVLCSAAFRFVARRDTACHFAFAAIQEPAGTAAALAFGIDPDQPDTFAVVLGGRALMKSDGVVAILRRLPGWRWSGLLLTVPLPIRDWVYDRVARNRYRLFGQLDSCLIPDPALAAHMVGRGQRPASGPE